ncbi:DinB family protein [Mesobacillus subterraneus]|uniref:DinB family protein n=1 Tax=Mesobacillus subterraneus TaxID=285983 RepID=A0A3R9E1G8_9BACI|nr:DinB family protein [Mesobacillus subterraneus]RSD23039.1 DinB family protein [Mesobacillus subterraneus]
MFNRPALEEFPEYTRNYIDLVPEGNIIDILKTQQEMAYSLLSGITEEQAQYRYGKGKWSLSEVLGHLSDTERIMSYRILRIARGDRSPLEGFDENRFVEEAIFHLRPMADLLEEHQNVRKATISLLKGLPVASLKNKGNANGYHVTVETVAYMIAGHEQHHLKIIKERYLGS